MAELFELNPELLLQQSQEMMSLRGAYESLFSSISSDLQGMNQSWSDLLSHNFAGKITGAQKTFSGALAMLQNSANSAMTVAQTAQELDTAWASKLGGSFMFDRKTLGAILDKVSPGNIWSETQAKWAVFDEWREKMGDKLSSSQKAWIELIAGKVLDDYKTPVKMADKLLSGEYLDAADELGKEGMKILVKDYIVKNGLKISDTDAAMYAKYGFNLIQDGAEGVTQFCLDPSVKNLARIFWNVSGQPIMDTAGSEIEKVVKLIPGISEYYDEKGAENIGDMMGICLGDFYELATGDEEMGEWTENFFKERGSMFDTMWHPIEDIPNFIKDMGGVEEAAKAFGRTWGKDMKSMLDYHWGNIESLWSKGQEVASEIDSSDWMAFKDIASNAWQSMID